MPNQTKLSTLCGFQKYLSWNSVNIALNEGHDPPPWNIVSDGEVKYAECRSPGGPDSDVRS